MRCEKKRTEGTHEVCFRYEGRRHSDDNWGGGGAMIIRV